MKAFLLLCLIALAASLQAAPPVARMNLETHLTSKGWKPPQAWTDVGPAPATETVRLVFAVKQQNTDKLEKTLLDISNPNSPTYSYWMTRDEVDQMVAPTEHAVRAVTNWIEDNGLKVTDSTGNSDFLIVEAPIAKAEMLLDTKYHYFEQQKQAKVTSREGVTRMLPTGKTHRILRCAKPYSVPLHIHKHLDFVGPCLHFPTLKPTIIREPQSPSDIFNDPGQLHGLYDIPKGVVGKNAQNSQAVAGFLEQYWAPADLQEFYNLFWNVSSGFTVGQVGYNDPTNPGTEAELDVQYITGMGTNVPTTVYYTSGRAPNPNNEPFLDWLVELSKRTTIPLLFSVSYGEDEKSVGLDYGTRVNTEFQKVGARGTSLFFAAGDDGAGGNCTGSGRFSPDFPSGSPWVTAVGGLIGGTPGQQPTGESVDSISGGGFSDYWPRPAWQTDAVQTYMSTAQGLPPQANWNASGRGYPDLAAQSEMFVVVQGGIPLPGVGGTSCASPTTAGVFALLNDARLNAGKKSLGYLNPLLYTIGANQYKTGKYAFNDATSGANAGCSFDNAFPAAKGWDASSGWGSPSYTALLPIVLALP